MNKKEFLDTLKVELKKQSIVNIDNMIQFYDEMICDRMEDGMSEEEAVASMDSVEEIVKVALLDKPMTELVKEKVKKSKEKAEIEGHGWLWILLAVLGFPIWLPILIVIAVCFLVICIVYWVLVMAVGIVILCIPLTALACFIGTIFSPFVSAPWPLVLTCVGGAMAFGSASFLLYKPVIKLFKGTGQIFVNMFKGIKRILFR